MHLRLRAQLGELKLAGRAEATLASVDFQLLDFIDLTVRDGLFLVQFREGRVVLWAVPQPLEISRLHDVWRKTEQNKI